MWSASSSCRGRTVGRRTDEPPRPARWPRGSSSQQSRCGRSSSSRTPSSSVCAPRRGSPRRTSRTPLLKLGSLVGSRGRSAAGRFRSPGSCRRWLLLVPLNWLVFSRLVPTACTLAPSADDAHADWRQVVRFAAGDYFADIVRFLGAEGVVLIVLAHLGPEASAPLFFAITIAASLQLVASNVMSAFVAEAAARPTHVDELLQRAALQITVLVVPGALIAYGHRTARALAVRQRVRRVGHVGPAPAPARRRSRGSSSASPSGRARYRRRVEPRRAPGAGAVGPTDGRRGVLRPAFRHRRGRLGDAGRPDDHRRGAPVDGAPRPGVGRPRLQRWTWSLAMRSRIRQQRRTRAAATVFDELDTTRGDGPALWPRSVIATEADAVGRPGRGDPPYIVKVALSAASSQGLQRHATCDRSDAQRNRGHVGTGASLPKLLEIGTCIGQTYVVESACSGDSHRSHRRCNDGGRSGCDRDAASGDGAGTTAGRRPRVRRSDRTVPGPAGGRETGEVPPDDRGAGGEV